MTASERRFLALVTAAHLALFALLSVSLAHMPPLPVATPDMVPVEYVEIGPEPTVTAPPEPTKESAPRATADEPTPAAPEPEVAPDVPDESPQDTVVSEAPTPKAEKPKKAEKPAPEPKKAVRKASKAPPRPERMDVGALASLIDKALPESTQRTRETSAFAKSVTSAPANAKISARQIATLEQAIRAQIAPCWNPPIGGADVQDMSAILSIQLKRDGSIAAPPVFVSQKGVKPGREAYARAFVDSAKRAVLRCTPLKLPEELYGLWGNFELNFDPRLMT